MRILVAKTMFVFYIGVAHIPGCEKWAYKKAQEWVEVLWGLYDASN